MMSVSSLPLLASIIIGSLTGSQVCDASRDDTYYPLGTKNALVETQPMYWRDAINILEDIDQFETLSVRFHSCVWSPSSYGYDDYYSNNYYNYGNDYWYLYSMPRQEANVAFSLYGKLKRKSRFSLSGGSAKCTQENYINSFYTTNGFTVFLQSLATAQASSDIANLMNGNYNNAGYDKYSRFSTSAECYNGYGVSCTENDGFAVFEYGVAPFGTSTTCDDSVRQHLVGDMTELNSALQTDAQCVEIYNANSYAYGYKAVEYNDLTTSALSLLSYSSSCTLLDPIGKCPDPFRKLKSYQRAFGNAAYFTNPSIPLRVRIVKSVAAYLFAIMLFLAAFHIFEIERKLVRSDRQMLYRWKSLSGKQRQQRNIDDEEDDTRDDDTEDRNEGTVDESDYEGCNLYPQGGFGADTVCQNKDVDEESSGSEFSKTTGIKSMSKRRAARQWEFLVKNLIKLKTKQTDKSGTEQKVEDPTEPGLLTTMANEIQNAVGSMTRDIAADSGFNLSPARVRPQLEKLQQVRRQKAAKFDRRKPRPSLLNPDSLENSSLETNEDKDGEPTDARYDQYYVMYERPEVEMGISKKTNVLNDIGNDVQEGNDTKLPEPSASSLGMSDNVGSTDPAEEIEQLMEEFEVSAPEMVDNDTFDQEQIDMNVEETQSSQLESDEKKKKTFGGRIANFVGKRYKKNKPSLESSTPATNTSTLESNCDKLDQAANSESYIEQPPEDTERAMAPAVVLQADGNESIQTGKKLISETEKNNYANNEEAIEQVIAHDNVGASPSLSRSNTNDSTIASSPSLVDYMDKPNDHLVILPSEMSPTGGKTIENEKANSSDFKAQQSKNATGSTMLISSSNVNMAELYKDKMKPANSESKLGTNIHQDDKSHSSEPSIEAEMIQDSRGKSIVSIQAGAARQTIDSPMLKTESQRKTEVVVHPITPTVDLVELRDADCVESPRNAPMSAILAHEKTNRHNQVNARSPEKTTISTKLDASDKKEGMSPARSEIKGAIVESRVPENVVSEADVRDGVAARIATQSPPIKKVTPVPGGVSGNFQLSTPTPLQYTQSSPYRIKLTRTNKTARTLVSQDMYKLMSVDSDYESLDIKPTASDPGLVEHMQSLMNWLAPIPSMTTSSVKAGHKKPVEMIGDHYVEIEEMLTMPSRELPLTDIDENDGGDAVSLLSSECSVAAEENETKEQQKRANRENNKSVLDSRHDIEQSGKEANDANREQRQHDVTSTTTTAPHESIPAAEPKSINSKPPLPPKKKGLLGFLGTKKANKTIR